MSQRRELVFITHFPRHSGITLPTPLTSNLREALEYLLKNKKILHGFSLVDTAVYPSELGAELAGMDPVQAGEQGYPIRQVTFSVPIFQHLSAPDVPRYDMASSESALIYDHGTFAYLGRAFVLDEKNAHTQREKEFLEETRKRLQEQFLENGEAIKAHRVRFMKFVILELASEGESELYYVSIYDTQPEVIRKDVQNFLREKIFDEEPVPMLYRQSKTFRVPLAHSPKTTKERFERSTEAPPPSQAAPQPGETNEVTAAGLVRMMFHHIRDAARGLTRS